MMSYYRKEQFPIPRRRFLTIACFALVALVFLVILGSSSWSLLPSQRFSENSAGNWSPHTQSETVEVDKFHYQNYVKGPPTMRFRDNLLPNVKYISSWISAGWTNDVMTYINLIYLGYLTNRVPVIGMFTPSHIGGHVPPISFGEVFDVPRLTKAMNAPLLEWHQVKNQSSQDFDDLGCWSVWEAVSLNGGQGTVPRGSAALDLLKLDISFTKAPTWIKSIPRYEHDQHSSFAAISTLAFPETRAESIVEPRESPQHHVKLPPDEHMLCFDYLYYVCQHQPYEFDFDFSPAWLFVGQHLHWTPRLTDLADSYLRRAFGVQDDQQTPPYISIHLRHGDFSVYCGGEVGVDGCFAPLSVIARRVEEVKQELFERMGLVVNYVVMTSDERNTTWWEDVTALGWFGLDHSQTVELYGDWYPVLIDAVVQAGGIGFIGTDRSTMSILARRRVESWWNGAARMVKWGNPHADDH